MAAAQSRPQARTKVSKDAAEILTELIAPPDFRPIAPDNPTLPLEVPLNVDEDEIKRYASAFITAFERSRGRSVLANKTWITILTKEKGAKWKNREIKPIPLAFIDKVADAAVDVLGGELGPYPWLPALVDNDHWRITPVQITPNYDDDPFPNDTDISLLGLYDNLNYLPLLHRKKDIYTKDDIEGFKKGQLTNYVCNFLLKVIDASKRELETEYQFDTEDEVKRIAADPKAERSVIMHLATVYFLRNDKKINLDSADSFEGDIIFELVQRKAKMIPPPTIGSEELMYYYNPKINPVKLLLQHYKNTDNTKDGLSKIALGAQVTANKFIEKIENTTDPNQLLRYNLIIYNCAKALAAEEEARVAARQAERTRSERELVNRNRTRILDNLKEKVFDIDGTAPLWWCDDVFVQLVASETLYVEHWQHYVPQNTKKKTRIEMYAKAGIPTAAIVVIDAMVSTIRAFNEQTQRMALVESEREQLSSQCLNVAQNCEKRIGKLKKGNESFIDTAFENFEKSTAQLKGLSTTLRETFSKQKFYKKMLIVNGKTVSYNSQFSTGVAFGLNLLLKGAPGTSKSESTKSYSKLLHDLHMASDTLVTCSVADVHGQYIGETATKTRQRILESLDGLLFLDEAYAMVSSPGLANVNYGAEFNGVLVERMSRTPLLFHVVAAGYENEMENVFLKSNPGYSRRFRTQITLNPTMDDLVNATTELLKRSDPSIDNPMGKVLAVINHFEEKQHYSALSEVEKRKTFFPAYYSACQEVATLVLEDDYDGKDKLPPIFETMRSQEASNTTKVRRKVQDIIEENATLVNRVGRFGEQDLVDWSLAGPLLEREFG
jgi:hypothetical protein